MKQLLLSLGIMFTLHAQAQLTNVLLEPYVIEGGISEQPPGTTTYRLYATFQNPTDRLVAVFSTADCYELEIATTTHFYNDVDFGEVSGNRINTQFFQYSSTLAADSWVTIGADNEDYPDVYSFYMEDGYGYGFYDSFHMDEGVNLNPYEASWFAEPSSILTMTTGLDNRVLIGQFTTSGTIRYKLNMQVFTYPNGTDNEEVRIDYVWNAGCYGEGAASEFAQVHPSLIFGYCNDPAACNYEPTSELVDGCVYLEGCTDATACNFNANVCIDDATCEYINGCTDPYACNYNDLACSDDGSCDYSTCGCNIETACNYYPAYTTDVDCDFVYGCTNPIGCNFNADACDDDGSCEFATCGCNEVAACNYNPIYETNVDCQYIEGCMDPTYCDYNPSACIDTGCSSLGGCIDELAANYDPEAECTMGCEYSLSGIVFHDINSNGIQDEGEQGIAMQTVYIGNAITMLTDDFGHFTAVLPNGNYSVYVLNVNPFPVATTAMPVMYNTGGGAGEIAIGKNFVTEINGIDITLYPNWDGLVCDQNNNFNICYRNMGNVPIDGYVEFTKDGLIPSFNEVTPIDSIVGDKAYLSFENLMPLQMFFYDIGLQGTSFELMGEYVVNAADAYGYDNNVQVAYGQKVRESQVLCAYDPNDKQVFPMGYAEPHYIRPDTTLEYLVRFQNTGNFQAFNVLVRDTISEHLDLSTFELVANSHSVQTCINAETREIQFFFENINLPDSTCCEADSHGLIAYKIRTKSDLAHNTEIENTAYIFFDSNPAIVTNTTLNTIFVCDSTFADIDGAMAEICAGEELQLIPQNAFISHFGWMLDGELIGDESELTWLAEAEGTYALSLLASSPVCADTETITVDVLPAPQVAFISIYNTLIATEGSSYQWYINDTPIDGADEQIFDITVDGVYHVEITNPNGCVGASDAIFIAYVGVNDINAEEIALYPVPVQRGGVLHIAGDQLVDIINIRVSDANGRVVFEHTGSLRQINIGDWPSGSYTLELAAGAVQTRKQIIVN
ncbi:MAG: T9SS type A sorting domain-containing protein [Cryomorphaceae bacterium]|nr:T9SS type A sorting domain-containing protein [Cryomorphaceae bacterium]